MIRVRALTDEDVIWKREALRRAWGDTVVARKGELIDALALDGFVAVDGVDRVGLLTFAVRCDEFEIVTISVDHEGVGAGRALMDAEHDRAVELGAHRMWLVTTNDNVRAFASYQRWGMHLSALDVRGVTASRAVKPSIPLARRTGHPIRDELEFELPL